MKQSRILFSLFSIFTIFILTNCLFTEKLKFNRRRAMPQPKLSLSNQVANKMNKVEKDKAINKIKHGKENDPDEAFQKEHKGNNAYLFKYYFNEALILVRRYIDNYLNMATEGKLLSIKNKKVSGKRLKKVFEWAKKYANKKKHHRGILTGFNFREIKIIKLKVDLLLRLFKLVESNKSPSLSKKFIGYFDAFQSGIDFLKKFHEGIVLYQKEKMAKKRTLAFKKVSHQKHEKQQKHDKKGEKGKKGDKGKKGQKGKKKKDDEEKH